MPVDLRMMRYVIAVAEAGSFEGAAERLHMTQPPLSRQVRELERKLGVTLFHRRPTRLTEAGHVFVESARQVLAGAEEAVERTRRAAGIDHGAVRVGYAVTTAFDEMPKLFAAMRARHPGIRVEAREAWDAELAAAVAGGELDVLLGRHLPAPATWSSLVLRSEDFLAVVGAGHRLAGRAEVSLRDLRGETLRFFPRRFAPRYHDAVLAALGGTGEEFDVWENPLPSLRNLNVSLSDNGFMLLPRSLGRQLPGGIACLPLTDDLAPIELRLSWERDPSPAVTALIRTARRLARREGWASSAPAQDQP
ncbi:LysR family transcriptional regulator [Nonomuraea diastatica]|uniref:LysR family transcriptional regulator n=1 Tax=Nonomuraea diastatica TaxID=1848329 RepID=A0A4V2YE97_9ACTN|nr:LysR substrate-binding domain-containing protein [Nonomuraea diastatica]TDD18416.1 LysR family transcriptional regulator [Nonomuraea diastatica]